MGDVINIGKVPFDKRFNYSRTLQKLMNCSDDEKKSQLRLKHELIVRQIESMMNLPGKVNNYKANEWRYFIDDEYNFWLLNKDYVKRNFIVKEG